uniref:Glycosyltransferase 2-like domain-containing protein n=1 Tax=viral metagenome TaxID=1070528 RepID=A0A6C0I8S9_9ZZZZ
MEITITEKADTDFANDKATICLNMIVKNESHIIKGTLEMLCNKIRFDYWVICDTGSTDDTQDIITQFFKDRGIPGELFSDEWTDFAHNRTLALNRAFGKTDLLLVFDADDEIHGDICIPSKKKDINHHEYHLKFGNPLGTSYTRVLLINNKRKFRYLSVLHEFISALEPNSRSTVLEGDYYVVSGRSGNRSKDPKKYLNDALILEKAHAKALATGDQLYLRYAFYCANSYKDYGSHEEAIKWYKITLKQDNWVQEKYVSCLYIYNCYAAMGQKEHGFYYLIEAFSYDIERVECLYPLIVHYCCSNQHNIAYNYYLVIKDYYEKQFLKTNMDQKLFIKVDEGNFFLPYYMILVADKIKKQDFNCVIKMFEIIFIKKQKHIDTWYIKNMLYNLQFFIQHVKNEEYKNFIGLVNDYIRFLKVNGLPLETFDFLKDYGKYGIAVKDIFLPLEKITNRDNCRFSKVECENSNNILFYVGFSEVHWNYSYLKENAIGGSEKAVAYLSKAIAHTLGNTINNTLKKIYIVGDVKNEVLQDSNITYLHLSHFPKLMNEIPFHTVVCSRYISFLEMYNTCSFHQFYIWAHDTSLLPYGSNLSDNAILEKWSNYIDGCVCQTNWHANEYKKRYPSLKDKISIINNGINTVVFPSSKSIVPLIKQTNKFIYTSRTERGLTRVLELWPQILLVMSDAKLVISTYTKFPLNKEEEELKNIIDMYDSIRHLGQLNTEQLYNEMSTADYWLYPTGWPETSCITALEMLMSEVICLYYPVAGLTDTMDNYGIQIQKGNEIETLMNLTADKKTELRADGKAYAKSCSWENRAKTWTNKFFGNLLINKETDKEPNKETILFFLPFWYNQFNLQDYFDSYNSKYNVIYTNNTEEAINLKNVDKVIFVFEVSNETVYDHFFNLNQTKKRSIELSILNTEPMNLNHRFQNIAQYLRKYQGIKVYDYSLANIHILNAHGFNNTQHMPYLIYKTEQELLINLNQNTEKIYDFGIISRENPVIVDRRLSVVNFLIKNGYTVNVIQGFKEPRDKQIATCRILLNIHGANNGEEAKIFEHIRCDRLLAAGYKVLSEDCLHLHDSFVKKYADNLTIIEYNNFFNQDTYSKFENLSVNLTKLKITDCFIFYNELEMLTYRLNLLYNIVDYFIIVEARQTFVGLNKPLYFDENKHLFQQFSDKIIHVIVDLPFTKDTINISTGDQWTNEKHQRNCIAEGLKQIDNNLSQEDIIIIADLDEIPDPNTLSKIKTGQKQVTDGISRLEQDFYYYNLNSKRNEKWYHCKILTVNKYKELRLTCEEIRFLNCDTIVNGGWHLSYFGDTKFIKNKLENFAHQEYNSAKYTDTNEIQRKIDNNVDLFGRDTSINSMTYVDIFNNDYLPPLYNTYLKSFYTISEIKREQKLLHILNNNYYNSGWKSHFEFGMFLVKYIKPNVVVELGVDYGHSTFCLASPNIGTVYAIDCFEGDINSGFKRTEHIFKDFKTKLINNSLLLSDNIIPIKGYFDDVILTFDKEIDILHIDGLSAYNAIKNDFEKWSLKTTNNAVIIIHNVISYANSIGKFFNEIEYPKFYFSHSTGLGVVFKNKQLLEDLLDKLLKTDLQCNKYLVYNKKEVKKYCFIHSCTFPKNGTKKLDYIVDKINSSGLINVLDNVFINNIGIPIENTYNSNNVSNNKYILTNYSENSLLYENPTINKMRQFAEQNPESLILYLHTKGNSYDNEIQSINDWTDMMLYFLVEKYDKCINKITTGSDTVGCNYSESPYKHYPGNFWWAKSSYIKTLNFLSEDNPNKMAPEFWVLQNLPKSNIYTIHSSGVNHYHELYPRALYQKS